jgi:8-oxo-dGTP pyrophosphatase MutT (NUDIX family)
MEGAIRAAVVIKRDGKFLLVQEGHAGAYGLWNWQQGKVEQGESIEEAAIREAKEETGYEVSILKKLTVVKDPFPRTREIHVFLGEIVGGEPQAPEGEIIQAKWFAPAELEEIKELTPGSWVYEILISNKD